MAALAKSRGRRRLHGVPEPAQPRAGVASVPIPFVDLDAQRRRLGVRLDAAIERVLAHGRFIMGPEVAELETELAAFCGAGHAIACANINDACANSGSSSDALAKADSAVMRSQLPSAR